MVERKEYLDQLWAWKDERQIKVVTGIRRCGKSVLLEQYQQRLLANGVAPEQIISINFENLDYEPLKDYMRLYNYLKERLCVDKMTYIFLDEVQEVPSFETVVDSLYIGDHVDRLNFKKAKLPMILHWFGLGSREVARKRCIQVHSWRRKECCEICGRDHCSKQRRAEVFLGDLRKGDTFYP